MKIFENVKVGYEIEFLNSDNKTETALVKSVNNKKFTISSLRFSEHSNSYYDLEMSFFLSGKKTNRYYTYGNAIKIINKWV